MKSKIPKKLMGHVFVCMWRKKINNINIVIMFKIDKSTWGSSSGNGRGNEVSPNRKSWVQILGYPSPVKGYLMDM